MFPWKKGNIRLVLFFSKGRGFRFFIAVAATVLSVGFSILTPQIIRVTVDSVLGDKPFELPQRLTAFIESLGGRAFLLDRLYICALAVVAAYALSGLTGFLRRYLVSEMSEYTVRNMRDKLFDYIQKLPYDWHIKIQTGDIIQRCTSDVEMVKNFLSNQLIEMIRIVVLVAISLIMMFSMDVTLTWAALALIPLIFLLSVVFFMKVSGRFKLVDEAEGALQTAVQENLTGVRVVRAFGRERFELDRFDEKNEFFAKLALKMNDLLSYYWSFGDIITGIQTLIVVVAGVNRCVNGYMTLGTFLSFYTYSTMLIWPVRSLGRMISELGKTRISLNRLRDILSAEPETDPEDSLCPEIKGAVEFDSVSFSYADKPVLQNVSFRLRQGETLAILGGTGSGKSTLTHLMCRLYDVPDGCGRVRIDGVDIRKIDRRHLRRHVGLVLQEPFLFSKSVRDNISAADPAATIEEIRRFAEIAAVDDSVIAFSQGYDTIIGERGVTLSGGQKQRVAIARMLMQHAPIMILDDSLSAVDAETDARIRRELNLHMGKRKATTIIISHRVSTLMHADLIMVLRDGRIEEMGSHEELMKKRGTYRRIFELQENPDIKCTEGAGL